MPAHALPQRLPLRAHGGEARQRVGGRAAEAREALGGGGLGDAHVLLLLRELALRRLERARLLGLALRLLGGLVFFSGMIVMSYNVWMTIRKTRPEPVAVVQPA